MAGEHFLIQAHGYTLFDQAKEAERLSALFDINYYRKPFSDGNHSLGYLRPIVWFAEYCLVEMAVGNKIYRQTFLHGTPQAEQTAHSLRSQPSALTFIFTLPRTRFQEVILDIKRLNQVIEIWEKRRLMRMASRSSLNLDFAGVFEDKYTCNIWT